MNRVNSRSYHGHEDSTINIVVELLLLLLLLLTSAHLHHPPHMFYRLDALLAAQPNSIKALKAIIRHTTTLLIMVCFST